MSNVQVCLEQETMQFTVAGSALRDPSESCSCGKNEKLEQGRQVEFLTSHNRLSSMALAAFHCSDAISASRG